MGAQLSAQAVELRVKVEGNRFPGTRSPTSVFYAHEIKTFLIWHMA